MSNLIIEVGRYFTSVFATVLNIIGDWLPNIIGAIAVFLVGLFIARWISILVKKVFKILKVEDFSKKAGVDKLIKSAGIDSTATGLLAGIIYWLILLIFISTATSLLRVEILTDFINKLIAWLPSIFAGLAIMVIGIIVAETLGNILAKVKHGGLYKIVIRWFILIVAFLTAIEQIGLNISFLTDNVRIIVAGFALGFGLAFGLGGKDKAKEFIEKHLS